MGAKHQGRSGGQWPVAVVVIDGERWHACPARGQNCVRISERIMGYDGAVAAMAAHLNLHHTLWI